MIRVWRLCRQTHAAFDGEGARLAGGRWNHRGTAVVYTSATLSLAILEYFVHLDATEAPADLVAIPADVPDAMSRTVVDPKGLPTSWRRYPAPEALAELGTRWAARGQTALLVVPSALVPEERNVLLNPAHPDTRLVRVGRSQRFGFDPRMWKGRS